MAVSLRTLTLVLFTTFLLTASRNLTLARNTTITFTKIFAFGDSYTDTGNTHSSTGPNAFTYVSRPPYGTTFFHRPTNRYSDGRLIIDFVAQSLSLPLLPPYLRHHEAKNPASRSVNFAVAGATAISHEFFVKNNLSLDITPQSLETELGWFERFLADNGCRKKRCDEVFKDALVWLGEVGANDHAYTLGSDVTPETIQTLAIKSITGFLQAILTKGAKYIVVQGLPPTGCLPLALALAPATDRDSTGCVATTNKQTYAQNAVLKSKLHDLRLQFPHAVIVYADFWNAYRSVMKNPKIYGFAEPMKACCGSGGGDYNFDVSATCGSSRASACRDPGRYVNWDGVHLTEAMYKVMADSVLEGGFCQPSFKFLLNKKIGNRQ